MPKERKKLSRPHKQQKKVVHPGSRKAAQMTKDVHHNMKVERRKAERQLALSNQVLKLMWFRERVDESKKSYTVDEMTELVSSYLSRHDDQLEEIVGLQLEKTHHTSSHYRQQHANKEDTLRHVIVKERELFEGAGFEGPDLTNPKLFKNFLVWKGEENLLPKIALRKYFRTSTKKSTE